MKNFHVTAEQSRAVFVNSATLEDRLLYDDVFVDYFNVFLHLKAFGTSIRYERLDGYYLETSENISDHSDLQILVDHQGKFLQQGAISLWIKEHRLPFFLRSQLFLEYKLCKLLLRKLSDTSRVQPSRLELRGYSRLSTPMVLPDSQWNDSPVYCTSQSSWPGQEHEHLYQRPLGSASSLPAMLSTAVETRLKLLEGPPTRSVSNDGEDKFDDDLKIRSARGRRLRNVGKRKTHTASYEMKNDSRTAKSSVRRTRSAPVEGLEERKEEDNEILFEEFSEVEEDTILCFDEEDVERTDAELRSVLDFGRRNLQEMKEDALSTSDGMREFYEFLNETSGVHLFNFWLDVEEYKHLEESSIENETTLQMMRVKLFREINDKYRTHLTVEAKQKIREALSQDGLTQDLFTRTQYDSLRRLRAYWIPRFLLHKEKSNDQRASADCCLQSRQSSGSVDEKTTLGFLPKISFVHSLPPRGDWCIELAKRSVDWSKNLTLSNVKISSKKKRNYTIDQKREYSDDFLRGLSCEKDAGWPFRTFLGKLNKRDEISNLLFWQSIEDLKDEETRGCDRHLHLCSAWNIVKSFLSNESNASIVNMSKLEKQKIIEKLRHSMEVSSTLFTTGQTLALEVLRSPWEDYLKDDKATLRHFIKRSIEATKQSTAATDSKGETKHASMYQSIFTRGKWYPSYPESSPSQRQRRLHTAMTIAENIETTRMSLHSPEKTPASVAKKQSGIKSTTAPRSKEKTVKFNAKKEKINISKSPDSIEEEDDDDDESEDTPAQSVFRYFLNDKNLMSSFKQYVQNTEGSHALNSLALFLDIESYKEIPPSDTSQKTQLASQIFGSYFDQSSRKCVHLPASIPFQIKDERPLTPTLVETQNHLLLEIEASFKQFQRQPHKFSKPTTIQVNHHNTQLVANKNETASNSFVVYYKRKRNRFKGPGRVQPTKEDKTDFVNELRDTYGILSPRLELFRRYLDNSDDVHGDNVSKLENDLLFYLEVQKFKDLFLYMDTTILLRKVDAIVDCFLDSATPPSVQIDISSDLASRTVHKVQSLHGRKSRDQRDCVIFDEAQSIVLKELLPFWAGFTRQNISQLATVQESELPPTRRQMIIKRRYSDFKTFPRKKRPVSLRSVLPSIGESKRELNYSIAEGLAWKESFSEGSASVHSTKVRTSVKSGNNSRASHVS